MHGSVIIQLELVQTIIPELPLKMCPNQSYMYLRLSAGRNKACRRSGIGGRAPLQKIIYHLLVSTPLPFRYHLPAYFVRGSFMLGVLLSGVVRSTEWESGLFDFQNVKFLLDFFFCNPEFCGTHFRAVITPSIC